MQRSRFLLGVALTIVVAVAFPGAQGARRVEAIRVHEDAGIRRTQYPVHAEVQLTSGTVADASHARLISNAAPVPAQFTVLNSGGRTVLAVDFNASMEPDEARNYELEYGSDVTAGPPPAGLAVTESADAVQVGTVKFNRSAAPLIASATYVRSEFIGQFDGAQNGLSVEGVDLVKHDLATASSLKLDVIERGPLLAVLQYSGQIPLDANYQVPVVLRIEMPNSKSWIKIAAAVEDPADRVAYVNLATPLSLGPLPLTWDFGTDNGTYGALRNAADAVELIQTGRIGASGARGWFVRTGTAPNLTRYESSLPESPRDTIKRISQWGHLQGAATAVAFGIPDVDVIDGGYSVDFDGRGQTLYRFGNATTATARRFTVYQHFVSTPIAIGAATSPASMLHPPLVTIGN